MSTSASAANAKVLHLVKARHAFNSSVADQMSFAGGDSMHIVAKNGGWWMAIKVNNPAERGWVPSNYLSIVDEKTGALEKVQVTPRTQAGQVRPETIAGTVNLTIQAPAAGAQSDAGAANGSLPATNGKPLLYGVKALHRFTASQADGLSFEAGELFSVVDKKDGWLRAVNAVGKEGWVPSNYVQQVAAAAASEVEGQGEEANKADTRNGEETPKPKMLAESAAEAAKSSVPAAEPAASPATASQEQQQFPQPSPRPDVPPLDDNMTPRIEPPTPRAPDLPTDSYVATPRVGSASGTDTPEEEYRDQVGDLLITPRMAQSIGQQQEKVRAMHNFDAKKPDHLSFKKGDIMIVIKKKAGWWKCHHEGHSGKVGYIPSNYVKALVEVEPTINPTTTILTAAGNVTIAADFEPTKERPLLVKASHSYKALANNQLSFSKHDLLHVIHKNKGWYKAYRVADAEKIGYIPSNYVKVQGAGEVASAGATAAIASEGASSSASSTSSSSSTPAAAVSAAAAATVEMEEIAIAIHDLEKKDPKCLPLKRDERFQILDKNVGGGWWKCTSLTSGDTGLTPSNFLKTEMAPKRQAPPLPPARGTVGNQPTMFVEGTYDFTAKKPSQLSYKKYDPLIILKKDGSWWKARNKMGKEGVIPYNYVKEVFPSTFTALFDFKARTGEEATLRKDEIVSVSDMDAPGWWSVETSGGSKGYVPSNYLHPNSTRHPGTVSAPATPRTAAGPEVPSTPRNPDGTTRLDPIAGVHNSIPTPRETTATEAAASASVAAAAPAAVAAATSVVVEQPQQQQVQPVVIDTPPIQVESLSAPNIPVRRYSGILNQSPLSNPSTAGMVNRAYTPIQHAALASVVMPQQNALANFASPSQTPRPEFMHEVVAPVRAAPARPAQPAPQAAPSQQNSFFDHILPSQQPQQQQDSYVTPLKGPPQSDFNAAASPPASNPNGFSGFSPAPQVEGRPSNGQQQQQSAAHVFGYYEGEGEVRPEGDGTNNMPVKDVPKPKQQDQDFKENTTATGSGIEIGSTNDPRHQVDLSQRGACAGGWQNWFGVFAACTGSNRSNEAIPKAGDSSSSSDNTTLTGKHVEEEKQQTK